MKMRIVKTGKMTEKLLASLKKLSDNHVAIGHFKEQGEHPTAGMSYVDLIKIHHNGSEKFPARPVLRVLKNQYPKIPMGWFKSEIGNYMKNPFNVTSIVGVFDAVGNQVGKLEKSIIGNPDFLVVGSNPTPLEDTGKLKEAVSYKNTITKGLKNAT